MALFGLRVAAVTLALATSATAHAASAIAYDENGLYGYQTNAFTQSAAIEQAVKHCARRSGTCTHIDSTAEEGYSAIFIGKAGLGYALAEKTPEQAQRKARAMCEKRASDCTLDLVWREKTGRQQLQVLPMLPPPATPVPGPAHSLPFDAPTPQKATTDGDGTISAVRAVELANELAPRGVDGRFRFEVKATDVKGPITYLSSEMDYRDQRNLGIAIEQGAARELEARLGAPPADALRGRRIEVTGRAERRKISFIDDGVPTGLYYYQTGLRVTDASQIKVIE